MDLPPQGKSDTVMGMSREAFLARLRKGYAIQTGVAFAFLAEGFNVCMPKYSEEDSDKFDLCVSYLGDGPIFIEVKGRHLTFTGPDDFPYDTILVTTASRWAPQRNDPPYYVFVSDDTGEAVCLLPNNDTVTVKHMVDKQKKVRDRFILSPTSELFTLEELFERLKS
jgi:hypothetical protein